MTAIRIKRKLAHRGRYKIWRERYQLKPLISVLLYLIVPLMSIFLLMNQYPLLAKERFYRMIMWIVPFGAALFSVTLIQERFVKGTKVRLGLDALFVGLTMAWLFGFLGGRTVVENSYGGWRFAVDVGPVVAIALCGTALNLVHDVLEYMVHKQNAVRAAPVEISSGSVARKSRNKGPNIGVKLG